MESEIREFLKKQIDKSNIDPASEAELIDSLKPLFDYYINIRGKKGKELADKMLKTIISGLALTVTDNIDEAYTFLNEVKQMLIIFEKRLNEQ